MIAFSQRSGKVYLHAANPVVSKDLSLDHFAPIIQNLGWSTISNLIRKETVTLTYKSLNLLAPDYLRKLLAKCSDDRERFLRSSETDLNIPLLKATNGQKAFSYRGPKLWNSLERATKLASSLQTFKEQL